MADLDNRAVMIDRVISRAVVTIRDNPLVLFGLALLFAGVPSAVTRFLSTNLRGARPDNAEALAGYGAMLAIWGIVSLCSYMLVQASITRATLDREAGRRAELGDCLLAGLRAMIPLIGLNILLGIAILIGLVLLVVPGVILAVLWAVANPALVAERCGVFGAFTRSRELTRGARWKVFGVELLTLVFTWLLSSASSIVLLAVVGTGGFSAAQRPDVPIWFTIFAAIIQSLIVTIWATIQASLYIELREWKEGPQSASLTKIFA